MSKEKETTLHEMAERADNRTEYLCKKVEEVIKTLHEHADEQKEADKDRSEQCALIFVLLIATTVFSFVGLFT